MTKDDKKELESLIESKSNRGLILNIIGMTIIAIAGHLASIYNTHQQIEANQKSNELKINSEFIKMKYQNEYNQKLNKFSIFVNATSGEFEIHNLFYGSKESATNLVKKINDISNAFDMLSVYISNDRLEEFTQRKIDLISCLHDIYNSMNHNDSGKLDEADSVLKYMVMRIDLIKLLKNECLDNK